MVIAMTDHPAADRKAIVLRELNVHGGSPAAAARALGVSVVTVQKWINKLGLRGEARRARDRWARMFSLGGNDRAEE